MGLHVAVINGDKGNESFGVAVLACEAAAVGSGRQLGQIVARCLLRGGDERSVTPRERSWAHKRCRSVHFYLTASFISSGSAPASEAPITQAPNSMERNTLAMAPQRPGATLSQ